jgi:hypothetical protein
MVRDDTSMSELPETNRSFLAILLTDENKRAEPPPSLKEFPKKKHKNKQKNGTGIGASRLLGVPPSIACYEGNDQHTEQHPRMKVAEPGGER